MSISLGACAGAEGGPQPGGDGDADGSGATGAGAAGSGAASSGGNGGSHGSGGVDGGSGGEVGSGGSGVVVETYQGGPCPDFPPIIGEPCDESGAICSYGEGPSLGCHQGFTCGFTERWTAYNVTTPCVVASGPCDGDAQGACDDVGVGCQAGDALCTCTPELTEVCGGSGCETLDPPIPQQWTCAPPPSPGCPLNPPNAGTACSDPSLNCLYGEPCGGRYVTCQGGYHKWEAALCP